MVLYQFIFNLVAETVLCLSSLLLSWIPNCNRIFTLCFVEGLIVYDVNLPLVWGEGGPDVQLPALMLNV